MDKPRPGKTTYLKNEAKKKNLGVTVSLQSEFQDSQGYTEKPCLEPPPHTHTTKEKKKKKKSQMHFLFPSMPSRSKVKYASSRPLNWSGGLFFCDPQLISWEADV